MYVLKKIIVISNTPSSDIKWLEYINEENILNGLNAIEVNQIKDAKNVGKLLYKHQLFDIFVFSKSKQALNILYKSYPYARLVYMPDTFNSLVDLSKDAFSHHAHTVCLKATALSQSMVRHLKTYGLVVFAYVEKQSDIYQAVLAGVDGLYGKNIDRKQIDVKGDYAFSPFVIAHRGYHAEAQENSLKAAKEATKLKADFVELDFHLTKDKHIVVNHDDSLGRTYEKDYVIRKDTLKSLQSIKMVYQGEKTDEVLPTLSMFHKQVKDTNTSLLIEAKTSSAVAMKRLNRVLNQMDRPPLLMSFYPFALVNFKKYAKGYSRGFLIDLEQNHMSVSDIIKISNKYNLMIHPYFSHSKSNLIEILKKRAILYCPWGLKNDVDLRKSFLSGYYGINTDQSQRFKDFVKYLVVKTRYTYYIGDTLTIDVTTDQGVEVQGTIEVLFQNPLGLVINDNQITHATLDGMAYAYITYMVKTDLVNYTLTTDLIQIEVKRPTHD